jgi:hypothetical protein
MNTSEKLDQLDDYQAQKIVMEMDKQKLIDAVYTPEIRQAVKDIDAEFVTKSEAVDENIVKLTEEIKSDVLQLGGTVKGSNLMAVWNKGRSGGYDTAKLDGMASIIPQIKEAKKPDGEPTVSIRKI